jgi:hypothetical protein
VDEQLVVEAEGQADEVPAFRAKTFGGGSIEVTAPPAAENGPPVAIRRAADLVVAWTGGPQAHGKITVTLGDAPVGEGDAAPKSIGPMETTELQKGGWILQVSSIGLGRDTQTVTFE